METAETDAVRIIPPGACNLDEVQVLTAGTKPTVFSNEPVEPDTRQMMRLVEFSGSLGFWDDPAEDVYTLDDGEPV